MAFRSVSIVASDTSIITAEGHHRESGSNQPAPFNTQHSSANQSLRHAQPLTGTKHQHADPVVYDGPLGSYAVAVSGPAGAGKSTLTRQLQACHHSR
jgi:predicted ATP-dependent serine protease